MKSELALQLEERFERYKELAEKGAWLSAASRLAEIFHCAQRLPRDSQGAWTQRILAEQLSAEDLEQIEAGIHKQVERVRRILSIGNRWTAEEILLVLQTRIEIDLLVDFLNNCLSVKFTVLLHDIDRDIESLAKEESHRHHFQWAAGKMKQNWGVPIESRWLRVAD